LEENKSAVAVKRFKRVGGGEAIRRACSGGEGRPDPLRLRRVWLPFFWTSNSSDCGADYISSIFEDASVFTFEKDLSGLYIQHVPKHTQKGQLLKTFTL